MNSLYIILLITSLFIFLELLLIIYCVNTMGKILKKINNITKIEISQSQINKSLIELFKSQYLETLESLINIRKNMIEHHQEIKNNMLLKDTQNIRGENNVQTNKD